MFLHVSTVLIADRIFDKTSSFALKAKRRGFCPNEMYRTKCPIPQLDSCQNLLRCLETSANVESGLLSAKLLRTCWKTVVSHSVLCIHVMVYIQCAGILCLQTTNIARLLIQFGSADFREFKLKKLYMFDHFWLFFNSWFCLVNFKFDIPNFSWKKEKDFWVPRTNCCKVRGPANVSGQRASDLRNRRCRNLRVVHPVISSDVLHWGKFCYDTKIGRKNKEFTLKEILYVLLLKKGKVVS